jgi:predicted double-glycine peptidase
MRSGEIVASMAALASLAACSGAPLREGGNRLDLGDGLVFQLPVNSMIGRRFETVVRQQYDFSCGSAALATLLRYHYDDPQDEQSVFLGMWRDGDQTQIRKVGFSLLDMKRYLAARGVSADGYRVTFDQIVQARTPGIALINFNGYRHFVVVAGIQGRTLILGDPSLGLRREDRSVFLKQWNSVYFVLNGRSTVADAHFNQSSDLVRAPSFRFYPDAEPLSLSGLALARPGLNSF